jgi:FkbM family methyltransferase
VISYAQNAEDVVLARALPGPSGFYVDVGAGDPEIASVTKHFYDLGWRGINIEPRRAAIDALTEKRPRDINLCMAAGASSGEADLYVVPTDPDLSTTDLGDAALLRARGYEVSVEVVPRATLDDVLEEHRVTTIDFLKIDVEGGEADVLAGIDLTRWQPRVIVIESVKPWSHERTDHSWRRLLDSQRYREACFDGINLFFAQEDDDKVIGALVPASVLDDYEPAALTAMRTELDRLRIYIATLEQELDRHRASESEVRDYVLSLEDKLAASGHVATVIDLSRAQPARPSAPARPARLAIIGTPRTGNTWIRRVLSDSLAARELPVHHPADVDWESLPDRVIIQLHWPRSGLLERTLHEHDFVVISPARHPLDVLLSILMFSQRGQPTSEWLDGEGGNEDELLGAQISDPAFLTWAVSPRAHRLLSLTPNWWSTPTTRRVRYEDLCADPAEQLAKLLAWSELEPSQDVSTSLADNSPARIHALSGGVHVWRAAPGAWRETLTVEQVDQLIDEHRETFVALGYDPDDRTVIR